MLTNTVEIKQDVITTSKTHVRDRLRRTLKDKFKFRFPNRYKELIRMLIPPFGKYDPSEISPVRYRETDVDIMLKRIISFSVRIDDIQTSIHLLQEILYEEIWVYSIEGDILHRQRIERVLESMATFNILHQEFREQLQSFDLKEAFTRYYPVESIAPNVDETKRFITLRVAKEAAYRAVQTRIFPNRFVSPIMLLIPIQTESKNRYDLDEIDTWQQRIAVLRLESKNPIDVIIALLHQEISAIQDSPDPFRIQRINSCLDRVRSTDLLGDDEYDIIMNLAGNRLGRILDAPQG